MSIEEKIQLIEKGTLEVIDTEELKEVLKKERGSLQLGSRFLRVAGNGMRNLGKGVTYAMRDTGMLQSVRVCREHRG